MPKPKSGKDPWKAVAVKLPPALLEEVGRYADLYHTSVSALIREGLELRLHGQQSGEPSSGITGIPPATAAVFARLTDTISTAVQALRTVCHLPTVEGYNGHADTPPGTEAPVEVLLEQLGAGMPVDAEPEASPAAPAATTADALANTLDYDHSKYVLGAQLCPRRHDYQGTGRTLLTRRGRKCALCETELQRQRREAKRQAAHG